MGTKSQWQTLQRQFEESEKSLPPICHVLVKWAVEVPLPVDPQSTQIRTFRSNVPDTFRTSVSDTYRADVSAVELADPQPGLVVFEWWSDSSFWRAHRHASKLSSLWETAGCDVSETQAGKARHIANPRSRWLALLHEHDQATTFRFDHSCWPHADFELGRSTTAKKSTVRQDPMDVRLREFLLRQLSWRSSLPRDLLFCYLAVVAPASSADGKPELIYSVIDNTLLASAIVCGRFADQAERLGTCAATDVKAAFQHAVMLLGAMEGLKRIADGKGRLRDVKATFSALCMSLDGLTKALDDVGTKDAILRAAMTVSGYAEYTEECRSHFNVVLAIGLDFYQQIFKEVDSALFLQIRKQQERGFKFNELDAQRVADGWRMNADAMAGTNSDIGDGLLLISGPGDPNPFANVEQKVRQFKMPNIDKLLMQLDKERALAQPPVAIQVIGPTQDAMASQILQPDVYVSTKHPSRQSEPAGGEDTPKVGLQVQDWSELAVGIDEKRQYWAFVPPPEEGKVVRKKNAKLLPLRGNRWKVFLEECARARFSKPIPEYIMTQALGYLVLSTDVPKDSRARPDQNEVSLVFDDGLKRVASLSRKKLRNALRDLSRELRELVDGPKGLGRTPLSLQGDEIIVAFKVRCLVPDGDGHLYFGSRSS